MIGIKEFSVEVAIVGSDKCAVFEWVDSLPDCKTQGKGIIQKVRLQPL